MPTPEDVKKYKPYPTKFVSRDIPESDRTSFPIEGVLEAIQKLKEEGFTEEQMTLKIETDFYDNAFCSMDIRAERPKTEEELHKDIEQLKKLQKLKEEEQKRIQKQRRQNELSEYKRLKKKFEK